jgi:hypothetical protein
MHAYAQARRYRCYRGFCWWITNFVDDCFFLCDIILQTGCPSWHSTSDTIVRDRAGSWTQDLRSHCQTLYQLSYIAFDLINILLMPSTLSAFCHISASFLSNNKTCQQAAAHLQTQKWIISLPSLSPRLYIYFRHSKRIRFFFLSEFCNLPITVLYLLGIHFPCPITFN